MKLCCKLTVIIDSSTASPAPPIYIFWYELCKWPDYNRYAAITEISINNIPLSRPSITRLVELLALKIKFTCSLLLIPRKLSDTDKALSFAFLSFT
jgi:hypothetical protein